MALYALGALVFVALGYWMAHDPNGGGFVHGWGWFTAAFGALGVAIGLKQIAKPTLGLRLDAEGIHSFQALKGNAFDLPWSELAGVRMVAINRHPLVVFDALDPNWGLEGVGGAVRTMRKANAALVGSWMTIAPRTFGVKSERVVEDVDRFRRHYRPDLTVEYPRPNVP